MPDAASNRFLTKVHLADKTGQSASFGYPSFVYATTVASSCVGELKLGKWSGQLCVDVRRESTQHTCLNCESPFKR
jgi:hypothetical protein